MKSIDITGGWVDGRRQEEKWSRSSTADDLWWLCKYAWWWVKQPDLVLVHRDRLHIITKHGAIEGIPDLVVEILSPSSAKRDKKIKLDTYARYEVPEYWIVDPENQVLEQYVLDGQQYALPEVYAGDDNVRSRHIQCVSLSMNEVIEPIPDLSDN